MVHSYANEQKCKQWRHDESAYIIATKFVLPAGTKKICRQLQPVVVEKWALIKACECSRFSSLLASKDVSPGGKSATQRQKFHTDDGDRCLHNKSGSRGVPNVNLLDFMFPLLGKVLWSFTIEPQQNSEFFPILNKNTYLDFWKPG